MDALGELEAAAVWLGMHGRKFVDMLHGPEEALRLWRHAMQHHELPEFCDDGWPVELILRVAGRPPQIEVAA